MFPTQLQQLQFLDKYARWNDKETRRETWQETVKRVTDYLKELSSDKLPDSVFYEIYDYILNLEVLPSMRLMAMAGEAARQNAISGYNCASVAIDSFDALPEILFILMAGTGVGFSVERQFVSQLPPIQGWESAGADIYYYEVQDSAEGWANALKFGIGKWVIGQDVMFDYRLVRPAGSRLKTKGGTASGSEPLRKLLDFTRDTFVQANGRQLTPLELHDICCMIGDCVISGGVRRSSLLSLFDADDSEMMTCKNGDLTGKEYRYNANNSAVWLSRLIKDQVADFFHTMDSGQRGEPGIFSRLGTDWTLPDRRESSVFGTNPCQPEWATVVTPDGIRTLGEISVGDIIWSGEQWTAVTNKVHTGRKPVYLYSTTFGQFAGTSSHRVIQDGIRIEAENAHGIDVSCVTEDFERISDAQAIMDGLVLGDGSVHRASNNLVYLIIGDNDHDYFDSEIRHLITRERPGLQPKAYEIQTTMTCSDLPRTYHRIVPERYLKGDRNSVANFLRGLYSANGSVVADGRRITLKQTSAKLIRDVQLMLSYLGVKSYITTNKPSRVTHHNGCYTSRQSYDLSITTDRYRFMSMIGFIQKYKNNAVAGDCATDRKSHGIISEIEFMGEHDVYDITVDCESHTYWTGGLLVSNCGEIVLRQTSPLGGGQFCNLSSVVAREYDTRDTLIAKTRIATIIGTIQASATNFPYLRPGWKANCDEERILGVDISGQMDCELVRQPAILEAMKEEAGKVNRLYSFALGINPATAITCVKPSGNSSVLVDCSPGIHARHAPYYIRRIRLDNNSPITKTLQTCGYPLKPENGQTAENAITWVAEFPVKSPDGAIVKGDLSAIEQLRHWLVVKEAWAEHQVSATITYRPGELESIIDWVYDHQAEIGGLSFLPLSEARYEQMPYEAISQERYQQMVDTLPEIDFDLLPLIEYTDMTTGSQQLACVAGQDDC